MSNINTLNQYRWKGYERPSIVCENCGKSFLVSPITVKRGRKYCSRACYNKHNGVLIKGDKHYNWCGGKKEKTCIVCQKKFYVKKEQEKRTGAKFCSLRCSSFYNVRYNHGSKNTDIENIIEKTLLKLNIPYEKQVVINGIALVDFLLPNKNIIQCDGDYWHALPITKARDERQDIALTINGYTVLRLLGSHIKKQLQDCERLILALTVENRADNVGQKG
jgi:very-short-patch-repair endonuclease